MTIETAIQTRIDNNNQPLVLDDNALVVDNITIEASQGALTAGTVLGEITADPGVYVPCDHTAVDGSQMPKKILAQDVADNVAQQSNISAYEAGMFDENLLVFGGTSTLDSRLVIQTNIDLTLRDILRMFSIYAIDTVSLTSYENA